MRKLLQAIAFATKAHHGHLRKYTGEPYVTHVLEVAQILVDHGIEHEDDLVAAILHDTVEDTNVTLELVADKFGLNVVRMVAELTDEYTVEKYPKINRAARKRAEAERAGRASVRSRNIKLADIISNAQSIKSLDPKFAKTYLPEMLELLEHIGRPDVSPSLLARATAAVRST